jgi:hypothetical protein
MVHSFGNSYGDPFIGFYVPPACSFNRVTLNLTVEAAGRQFDRLAVAYLGDVEVWRTSTAEPTRDGIMYGEPAPLSLNNANWPTVGHT